MGKNLKESLPRRRGKRLTLSDLRFRFRGEHFTDLPALLPSDGIHTAQPVIATGERSQTHVVGRIQFAMSRFTAQLPLQLVHRVGDPGQSDGGLDGLEEAGREPVVVDGQARVQLGDGRIEV